MRQDLLSSTAYHIRWGGNFMWWQKIEELRAFGDSWRTIERMVFEKPVRWE